MKAARERSPAPAKPTAPANASAQPPDLATMEPTRVLALQRSCGNRAVGALLGSATPRRMLARYPYTDDELRTRAAELSRINLHGRAGGPVTADDLVPLRASGLTPDQLDAAFQDLVSAGSGVQRGWNRNQDDLGWPVRPGQPDGDRKHATPYDYGWKLRQLSVATGASSYGDFESNKTARVRLAGAPMRVHPRAIYFVAAAQLGMDRSDSFEGEGHYIAPPALMSAVRDLQRQLRSVTRRTRGRPTPALEDRRRRALGGVIDTARDLVTAAEEFRARNTASDAAARGHEEPEEMVDWLLDEQRAGTIRSMEAPTDAAGVQAAAGRLAALLEDEPGRAHGMGAMDGHGTNHAMGLAIDYGTSSRSHAENRGIPDGHWPFLHFLMDGATSIAWNPPRPRAIHEMPHEQARQLSALVRGRGRDAYRDITGHELGEPRPRPEAAPAADAAAPATARERRGGIRRLVMETRGVLRSMQSSLQRLMGRRSFLSGVQSEEADETRDRIAQLLENIRGDIRTLGTFSPEQIRDRLGWYREQLATVEGGLAGPLAEQLAAAEERVRAAEAAAPEQPAATGRGRGRGRGRSRAERELRDARATRERLETQRGSAQSLDDTAAAGQQHATRALGDGLQEQWVFDQRASLRQLLERSDFKSWLRRAVDSGIYTQPDAYVEGIMGVHSHGIPNATQCGEAHFYGGHHWDIAPLPIISSDTDYGAALDRDMRDRSPDDLAAIVAIIQESASARQIFGTDQVLRQKLTEHGWSAPAQPQAAAPVAAGAH